MVGKSGKASYMLFTVNPRRKNVTARVGEQSPDSEILLKRRRSADPFRRLEASPTRPAGKIAGAIAISALNVLGLVTEYSDPRQSLPTRAVFVICYLVRPWPSSLAAFQRAKVYRLRITHPSCHGEFRSAIHSSKSSKRSLLRMREETRQLATEMKSFEAGSVREFVATLASPLPIQVAPKQSATKRWTGRA